jgi:TPP-dependent pyruvate/acetoin dehydrogenase alpha subunit
VGNLPCETINDGNNNFNHYRSVDEVRYWDQKDHPITKFASYLIKKGLWDESKEAEWKESSRKAVSKI